MKVAECILLRAGGGGIDPDELTARPEDVLHGKKFGGQGSDEAQIGTMDNFSDTNVWICGYEHSSAQVLLQDPNQAIVSGLVRLLPQVKGGYIENGTTKIEFNIANAVPKNIKYGVKIGRTEYGNNGADDTNTITGEFTGDANISSKDIRRGKIAYSKGQRIVGDMEEIGMISYRPTTVSQFIESEQFISGQLEIQGDKNLIAANIKKGVTIFGVTGTWEGYVPTVNDLYLYGNQLTEWKKSSSVLFEAGQIIVPAEGWIETVYPINLVGKTQLHVQYSARGTNSSSIMQVTIDYSGSSINLGAHTSVDGENTATFSLSSAQVNKTIRIICRNIGNRYIKRIWLT